MSKPRTLIVGIGNRYRSDDGFGCAVASELASIVGKDVQCVVHDGEPAALIECWEEKTRVLLVDAVSSGAPAGTLFQFDLVQQALPEAFKLYSTHAFGVPQAVELARALDKLPPEIHFLGVEGACFEAGEGLSDVLSDRKGVVINEILHWLDSTGVDEQTYA